MDAAVTAFQMRRFTPWMASTEAKSSEHFLFSCHLPDRDYKVLLGGAAMLYADRVDEALILLVEVLQCDVLRRYFRVMDQEWKSVVVS
jgi:hypothetical protein